MKRPRVIPTLLIHNGDLVKTTKFNNPRYLGDPINAIRIFNEKCVDELAIMDIGASAQKRDPDYDLLEKMASEAFMPLSYGGGLTSVEQMQHLFRIGFEKAIINTGFVDDMTIITDAAEYFGSQSVVCAIDYKKGLFGPCCYVGDGKTKTKYQPLQLAKLAEEKGAGEIILYSMDRDGKRNGYDLMMIQEISKAVRIPLISCGGADNLLDFKEAISSGASAVAAGSIFVFFGKKQAVLINYPEEKDLIASGVYTKD